MKRKRGLPHIMLFCILLGISVSAQPKLKIEPESIRFRDVFNRLQNVLLINQGNEILEIDSISYKNNFYYIRFDVPWEYPISIQPGDTVLMDCILNRYNLVTSKDTLDTMVVYNQAYEELGKIKIKIDFFNDNIEEYTVSGSISDYNNKPIEDASIYFYQEGKYLVDSSRTCEDGCFQKKMPVGLYTVAATKNGFLTTFYNQKYDPFNSTIICVEKDTVKNINFMMLKDSTTGISISGSVLDSTTNSPLRRAILVIRGGKHNPSKLSESSSSLGTNEIYTSIIKSDGKFSVNVPDSGFYFIQAFSDYYIPTYYSESEHCSVLWQDADSLFVNTNVLRKKIYLRRDSSFGAGYISGTITYNNISDNIHDVVVLAKSMDNDSYVSYNFLKENGEFKITNLPYGNFQLIAQKIGYTDATSSSIYIEPDNTAREGITLNIVVSSVDDHAVIPDKTKLLQNYPNPFNPSTNIQVFMSKREFIKISVSNILGQKVKNIFEGYTDEGYHNFVLDGSDLSSGIYLVSLTTKESVEMKKIMLVK